MDRRVVDLQAEENKQSHGGFSFGQKASKNLFGKKQMDDSDFLYLVGDKHCNLTREQ